MNQKACMTPLDIIATGLLLASFSARAVTTNIPITNPGAESGDLTLNVEDVDSRDLYQYSFSQTIGIWLRDINDNIFYGLGPGALPSDAWSQNSTDFSWWSQWNAQKG